PYVQIESSDRPPVLKSDLDIDLNQLQSLKLSGLLEGASFKWRGLPITSVQFPFVYDTAEESVAANNFNLRYGSGSVKGSAGVSLKSEIVTLQEVSSTADLIALASHFTPNLKESLKMVELIDVPSIKASGSFPMKKPLAGNLDIGYRQAEGLDLLLSGGRRLPLRDITGNFNLNGEVLKTRDLVLKVLDGAGAVNAAVNLADPNFKFNTSLELKDMNFQKVMDFAGVQGPEAEGLVNFNYRGEGSKQVSAFRGNGQMALMSDRLYKVPVIGPIQRVLGAIVPVFAPQQSRNSVAANFHVESGVIMTNDLFVKTDGTHVDIRGNANLNDLTTKFVAKGKLEGALGAATGIVTQAIEIQGEGPIAGPKISLAGAGIPAEFLQDSVREVLGIAGGGAEAVTAILDGVTNEIAGEGVRAVTNALGDGANGAAGVVGNVVGGVLGAGADGTSGVAGAVGAITGGATDAAGGITSGLLNAAGAAVQGATGGGQQGQGLGSALGGILSGATQSPATNPTDQGTPAEPQQPATTETPAVPPPAASGNPVQSIGGAIGGILSGSTQSPANPAEQPAQEAPDAEEVIKQGGRKILQGIFPAGSQNGQ
ncbi:MAG: AsmA-like C-terminal region-containing protein, partial [Verrucomicrobiota bacterium]